MQERRGVKWLAVFVAVCLTGVFSSAEWVILAGWDDGFLNPMNHTEAGANVTAEGISARLIYSDDGVDPGSHWRRHNERGSNDGTFGSLGTGARAEADYVTIFKFTTEASYLDFEITNHGAQSYELDYFCFDAWRAFSGGSEGFSLSLVAGDLALTNDFATGVFTVQGKIPANGGNDYEDIDVSLSDLGLVLGAGQSVTFRLELPAGAVVYLDNTAILGKERQQFSISSIQVETVDEKTVASITFESSGEPHTLQHRHDLVEGGWSNVLSGMESPFVHTNENNHSFGFYRIKMQ